MSQFTENTPGLYWYVLSSILSLDIFHNFPSPAPPCYALRDLGPTAYSVLNIVVSPFSEQPGFLSPAGWYFIIAYGSQDLSIL
jgi:hypothetical protein